MNAFAKLNTLIRKERQGKHIQISKELLIKKGVIRY